MTSELGSVVRMREMRANGEYFSPGPWHYSDSNSLNQTALVYGPDGYLVADAGRIHHRTEIEQRANGNLIALAPEMYELIAEMNSAFYGNGKKSALQAVMVKSRSILQRARGETPTP